MEVKLFNPKIGSDLMESCVYATTLAKKEHVLVQMLWNGIYYTCNPNITASKFFNHIILTQCKTS
jgi:hypothetical protein